MIVADASCLIAMLKNEEDANLYAHRLSSSPDTLLSTVDYVEVCMVMGGGAGEEGFRRVDAILKDLNIRIIETTLQDEFEARRAFLRYGKGRHHARLNMGDCFAYALAKRLGRPLLFKGNELVHTDVLRA